MKGVALLLLAAGCYQKPDQFGAGIDAPDDAPGDGVDAQMFDMPRVVFTEDGTGGNVDGGWFRVHFSNIPTGFHFPDLLAIDGVDHLGHAPAANCHAEDATGMALHPSERIAAYTAANIGTNLLTAPLLRGPGVVQVLVDWTTMVAGEDASMNPVTLQAQGSSRYTIFPDGKIVRYDHMDDVAGVGNIILTTSIDCASSTAGGWYPTSFTTLANLAGSETLFNGSAVAADSLPTTNGLNDMVEQSNVCLDYGTRRFAFAWRGVAQNDLSTRIRAPNVDVFAFVFDFTNLHNATTIPDFSFVGESAMFLDRGPENCMASGLSAAANAWSLPVTSHPAITFAWSGGSMLMRPGNLDGIYGGSGGPVMVPVPVTSLTLTGNLTTTFAVWLDFDRPVSSITVTKPGGLGPYYVAQPVETTTDEWVIWFRDPLAAGQTITISTP